MAFGGICGSLLGGYALSNIPIDKIFLLFSVLPAIQLFSCGLVEENPVDSKVLQGNSNSSNDCVANGNGRISDEDNITEKKSNFSTSKRRRSQKKKEGVTKTSKSKSWEIKDKPLVSQWFCSFKAATYSLISAFKQPAILR